MLTAMEVTLQVPFTTIREELIDRFVGQGCHVRVHSQGAIQRQFRRRGTRARASDRVQSVIDRLDGLLPWQRSLDPPARLPFSQEEKRSLVPKRKVTESGRYGPARSDGTGERMLVEPGNQFAQF